MERETLKSRLGFILLSAGCAIGIGNVWRFPYIAGKNGGGYFVLFYLLCLLVMGVPVLTMELAVGRASRRSAVLSYKTLEKPGQKWHIHGWFCLLGCYLLMMYYTTVSGWMVSYFGKFLTGAFHSGMSTDEVASAFGAMLSSPGEMALWAEVVVVAGFLVCSFGLQKGLERVTKVMMMALFVVLVALCVRAVTLPGAAEGLRFYLMPDFSKMFAGATLAEQLATFGDAVYAAMGQAFFTVSVGMGGMSIFGSYIGKDHTLTGEAVRVAGLDTLVALMAGLVIFPSCFAFGVEPGSGPGLVFITLPSVFNEMPFGQLWAVLFFVFMTFAALSTVIAVFENIMSFTMDQWGTPRKKACLVNGVLLAVLSMPCVLGFNVLAGFTVPGIGDIQAIEDFLVSNNILPWGGLLLVLFCTRKSGWGWEGFLAEADTGSGLKFPRWARGYVAYVIPVGMLIVFAMGYAPIIAKWAGLG